MSPTRRRDYEGRGRHRKATSRETVAWEKQVALPPLPGPAPPPRPQRRQLPPAPPAPSWMDEATRNRLLLLRQELAWS